MIFNTFNSFQTCPFESLLLSVGNELGETPRKDMKCNSSTAKTIKTASKSEYVLCFEKNCLFPENYFKIIKRILQTNSRYFSIDKIK